MYFRLVFLLALTSTSPSSFLLFFILQSLFQFDSSGLCQLEGGETYNRYNETSSDHTLKSGTLKYNFVRYGMSISLSLWIDFAGQLSVAVTVI